MGRGRHIRLTLMPAGASVAAELLDDEAPETCRLVWEMLPLERDARHGQYSGREIFVLLEGHQPASHENRTQMPLPGELLYWADPGGNVTSPRPSAEVCVIYGRGAVVRGPEGVPAYATLFARIPGDWKYDWTAFADACARVRTDGGLRLRVERAED